MSRFPRFCLLMALSAASAPPLLPDTITQRSAQGKVEVIQREAIVVQEDSSFVVYKHLDLKEQRVVKVVLNQGSLPYEVERSTPAERRQIVEMWRRFGSTANLTDQSGKVTRVFDAYLDFYPPAGRGSLLERVPARTAFPVLLDGGGTDSIEFSDISRVEIQGEHLKLTLTNGQVKRGAFLMPTAQPAEARLLGITDRYDPASPDVFDFSIPLSHLREIQFEQ